ncbi:hypothetical protein ACQPYV_09290 [Micromonospora saelicesensis]|uniref:hypothetical protein n=1 Tax=Micromonospora saelicesensis TaxID=285676 RepID=UPI003D94F93C
MRKIMVVGFVCVASALTGCGDEPQVEDAGAIRCGKPLPPIVQDWGGFAIKIEKAHRLTGADVAQVDVSLMSRSPTKVTQPGALPLQVLLVRDGIVIDRIAKYPLLPDGELTDWIGTGDAALPAIGATWSIQPDKPFTISIRGPGHCRDAQWNEVWENRAQFEWVAVMSAPSAVQAGSGSPSPAPTDVLLGGRVSAGSV